MNDLFKVARVVNLERARGVPFRLERAREAKKKPDDCQLPIVYCQLNARVSFACNRTLAIENRQRPEVRHVRRQGPNISTAGAGPCRKRCPGPSRDREL